VTGSSGPDGTRPGPSTRSVQRRTGVTSARRAGKVGGGPIGHVAQSLAPTLQAPARARKEIRNACSQWPSEDLETALLITSELVTNAVIHGVGEIHIAVSCDDSRLKVAVTDSGALAVEPPNAKDAFAETGRGLTLVSFLADAWGVETVAGHQGKTVWFRLSAKAGAPTTPAP
jgi:anti-sigma regulatory factor (Ser/Thr protein kinase)